MFIWRKRLFVTVYCVSIFFFVFACWLFLIRRNLPTFGACPSKKIKNLNIIVFACWLFLIRRNLPIFGACQSKKINHLNISLFHSKKGWRAESAADEDGTPDEGSKGGPRRTARGRAVEVLAVGWQLPARGGDGHNGQRQRPSELLPPGALSLIVFD